MTTPTGANVTKRRVPPTGIGRCWVCSNRHTSPINTDAAYAAVSASPEVVARAAKGKARRADTVAQWNKVADAHMALGLAMRWNDVEADLLRKTRIGSAADRLDARWNLDLLRTAECLLIRALWAIPHPSEFNRTQRGCIG